MRKQAATGWIPRAGFGTWGNALGRGDARNAPNAQPVARAPRRLMTGVAFQHQRTHLVLDKPDAHGLRRYSCRIANMSERGFGVTLHVPGGMAGTFRPGTRLTLEPANGRPERAEVKWVRGERMGIKRLAAGGGTGDGLTEDANEWIVERQVVRQSEWWKCRLILDRADAMGVREHVCRIVDHSEKGMCVTVEAAYTLPEMSQVGAKLILEQPNGRRVRAEVRWFKRGRVGLMLLPKGGH